MREHPSHVAARIFNPDETEMHLFTTYQVAMERARSTSDKDYRREMVSIAREYRRRWWRLVQADRKAPKQTALF